MKANITARLITNLAPESKPYDVRDRNLTGFIIRVNTSGKMLYMCEYNRGKRVTIGKVGVLTPIQARDKAKEILADTVKGIYPHSIYGLCHIASNKSQISSKNKIKMQSYIRSC